MRGQTPGLLSSRCVSESRHQGAEAFRTRRRFTAMRGQKPGFLSSRCVSESRHQGAEAFRTRRRFTTHAWSKPRVAELPMRERIPASRQRKHSAPVDDSPPMRGQNPGLLSSRCVSESRHQGSGSIPPVTPANLPLPQPPAVRKTTPTANYIRRSHRQYHTVRRSHTNTSPVWTPLSPD